MTTKENVCTRCSGTGLEPDDRGTGAAMRMKREQTGLTGREVARRMFVSPSYLSDLELGRRRWRTGLIDRYEKALDDD